LIFRWGDALAEIKRFLAYDVIDFGAADRQIRLPLSAGVDKRESRKADSI